MYAIALGLFLLSKGRWRRVVVLTASYVFYADATLSHLPILIGVSIVSYAAGRMLERQQSRSLLVIAVSCAALPLLWFKGMQFIGNVLDADAPDPSVLGFEGGPIPIGLSFYTLQAISYLVDVYRRTTHAIRSPQLLAQYLAFFPQLLAGPIERANNLAPQLFELRTPTRHEVYFGFKTILWGYFCKLVVANNIAILVDALIANYETVSPASLPVALYLFSFQIYFDFMGYSMIAIGIGLTFGIHLSANFNNPYLAVSIRDFWRRWHITLSAWLRDYIYQPIRGRQKGHFRLILAIAGAFLVSGLWHGATMTFLVWGAVHAAFYLIGYLVWTQRRRGTNQSHENESVRRLLRPVSTIWCFTLVSFAWLFFMVDDVSEVIAVLDRISSLSLDLTTWHVDPLVWRGDSLVFLALLAGAFVLDASGVVGKILRNVPHTRSAIAKELALVNSFIVAILFLGDLGNRAFIYFRF